MTTKTQKQETAAQAHRRLLTEAKRRLFLIQTAITAAETERDVDWGHVGSLSEVVKNLGHAGHWAGVAELTSE